MLQIPLPTKKSYFTHKVNLDETTVAMRFLWNEFDNHFFLDVENTRATIKGTRLIPNWCLYSTYGDKSFLNDGDLILLPLVELDQPDLGFDTFGKEWGLFYATDEEIETLKSNGVL